VTVMTVFIPKAHYCGRTKSFFRK